MTKIDEVSSMVSSCRSIEMIVAEMEKCQLLCGNCHVDVTTDRRQDGWRIWIDSLGKGSLEECLPELSLDWNMDMADIEDIIIDKNYRREVLERAHGVRWVDFIQWD